MLNAGVTREYIEREIVQRGLGIYDATDGEVDRIISSRPDLLQMSYALADMVSSRARIGVRPNHWKPNIVVYSWPFSDGCKYLCSW